jgi:hypothetical protein
LQRQEQRKQQYYGSSNAGSAEQQGQQQRKGKPTWMAVALVVSVLLLGAAGAGLGVSAMFKKQRSGSSNSVAGLPLNFQLVVSVPALSAGQGCSTWFDSQRVSNNMSSNTLNRRNSTCFEQPCHVYLLKSSSMHSFQACHAHTLHEGSIHNTKMRNMINIPSQCVCLFGLSSACSA